MIERLKQRIHRLLTEPGEELGNWARFVRFQIQLWRACIRRLHENNAMAMSAALSFRTLFTLVPILLLGVLMLKTIGAADESKKILGDIMTEAGLSQITFVDSSPVSTPTILDSEAEITPSDTSLAASPSSAPNKITVADKISELIDMVESKITIRQLGPVGVILLIWTALTLLTTIERSLNRIFEAPRPRGLGRRVPLYWATLTLAPILLLTVSFLVNKAEKLLVEVPVMQDVMPVLAWLLPALLGFFLLAALYTLIPNTTVRFRIALEGALVAGPLWLLARWAFGVYVKQVATTSLYGALGLVPLFLLWVNLSWWILLFGAQLAYTAAHLSQMLSIARAQGTVLTPWHLLAAVIAVGRNQMLHRKPADEDQVAIATGLAGEPATKLVQQLVKKGILCRVADGTQLVLAIPAEKLNIADILTLVQPYETQPNTDEQQQIAQSVNAIQKQVEASTQNMTIADLLQNHSSATDAV